jgi:hypothetical protein
MRVAPVVITLVMTGWLAGCGSDFEVPARPDSHVDLDLAVTMTPTPPDMACFNRACGGCSQWASFDGTPSKVGDPCSWKGTYACNGTSLTCMGGGTCLTCTDTSKHAVGTVCGADGHTIIELTYTGTTCTAYDLGSAIGVCNHGAGDHCVQRCTGPSGNVFNCVASCASTDGGGTGCMHGATDTCESLTGC